MSRVAFATDLHFDSGSRWEETLRIAEWCTDVFARSDVDAIALGGDVYEKSPNATEQLAFAEWLSRIVEIADVVGVRGNHDPKWWLDAMNLIKPSFGGNHIHLVDRPGVHRTAETEFVLLPWPTKGELLARLPNPSVEGAKQIGIDLLVNILRGLGLPTGEDFPRCFVGHVQMRDSKVSTGQPLRPGADFEIGVDDLALASCDAYLLGHQHMPQSFHAEGQPPMLYGGSWRRTAFGELEDKSIVIAEFNENLPPGKRCVSIERIQTPCAPMLLLGGEYVAADSIPSDGGDAAMPAGIYLDRESSALRQNVPSGAEVRLRYSVEREQREAAAAAAEAIADELRAAGAVHVKLDEQVQTVTRARAPEVAAAKTTGDKLAAYWRATDRVPEDAAATRLLAKLGELESEAANG